MQGEGLITEKAGRIMKKKNRRNLWISVSMLTAFVMWTMAVRFLDVKSIGPKGSCVGFASVNALVHKLTGVHMVLYHITDWLGLVPIFVALGFGLLGLIQWIKRKKLSRVDYSVWILGGFYVAVVTVYVLFETVTVNYRPVLIEGCLEVSYPSSTTLLVLCVMPTAMMQLRDRIQNQRLRNGVSALITGFVIFMVVGRLISGVHWISDIIGAIFLGSGLVALYRSFSVFSK